MLDLLKFDITARNQGARTAMNDLKGDLRGIKGAVSGVTDQMTRMGKKMRNLGAGLSAGVTAPLGLLGRQSVQLYDTQVKAEAAVAQAITSTGGAAGKTLDQLKGLASEMQGLSNFGDEDILRNVTAPLLSFTNIQDDVFDRAQQNVLDLSAYLKTDLKSASVMLGKALNDPIKGMSALSRAGVSFSDEQEKTIKGMYEAGDAIGAQMLMLEALENQGVKGQAAIAAATPLGQFNQLSMAIGDVKEQLGEQIVPFLVPLVEQVKSAVAWFSDLSPEVKKTIVVVGGLAAAVGPIVGVMGLATMGMAQLGGAIVSLGAALMASPLLLAIAAVAGGAYLIYRNWDGISGWFADKWDSVSAWTANAWGNIKATVGDAFDWVTDTWGDIGGWFQLQWGRVRTWTITYWLWIKETIFGAYDGMVEKWGAAAGWFAAAWQVIQSGATAAWSGISGAIAGAYDTAIAAWGGAVAFFDGIWQTIQKIVGGAAEAQRLSEATGADWQGMSDDQVFGHGSSLGGNLTSGLTAGIKGGAASPADAARGVIAGAVAAAEDQAGVKSPSRVFAELGDYLMQGLAMGVAENAEKPMGAVAEVTAAIGEAAKGSLSVMDTIRDGAKTVFKDVLTGAQSFRSSLSSVLGGWGSSLLNSGLDGLFDLVWPNAKGNVFSGGDVKPFADGAAFSGGNVVPFAKGAAFSGGDVKPFAKGAAFSGGNVVPFASGGVVSSPTFFPMAGEQTGLMGEAGPEAIMPLARGSDGSLGVRVQGRAGGGDSGGVQRLEIVLGVPEYVTMEDVTTTAGNIAVSVTSQALAVNASGFSGRAAELNERGVS